MSKLFDIQESTVDGFQIGEDFKVSDSSTEHYNILRLIIGNLQVTNLETGATQQLMVNYLKGYFEFNDDQSVETNVAQILNENISTEDLYSFFFDRRHVLRNKDFFIRLENEFCNFLTYQNKGSYTTAFVFLYRILEVISYSFPLIYVSKTSDFKHTYGHLKEMFDNNSGKNGGERGFLKSAVKVIFNKSQLLGTSVDILLEDNSERNKKIFKAVKSITDDKYFHADTVKDSKIAINFGDVSSFIINIRNRFFHLFNRGDKNLESVEIIDSDYFFSNMNAPLFQWICVLFMEINKFLLEEHLKNVR